MKISGHTKIFVVLGHPVQHTLSPPMHNAAFRALGLDAVYVAFDVEPSRLISSLRSMADMGICGVNITVPLKEVACKGLENLDVSARRLGAVNTVKFLPGRKLKGYNTDGQGFLSATREAFGRRIAGLDVLILGSGGAGRAVAITCACEGARSITLADINAKRTRKVALEIRRFNKRVKVVILPQGKDKWIKACRACDLVVQATPVGMKKDDKSLLPCSAFRRGQMAYDLVYMYPKTDFMRQAGKAGARTANGLGMLLHQGACSFAIWTGIKPDLKVMRKALEEKVYGR